MNQSDCEELELAAATVPVIGIGCGPSNLSLAAIISELPNPNKLSGSIFFEKRKSFFWDISHNIPGARMLSEFYWDLTTPINPQSSYTFMAYLHANERLSDFLNVGAIKPLRIEFSSYLNWVAEQLDIVRCDSTVIKIDFLESSELFKVETNSNGVNETKYSKNVVIGVGKQFEYALHKNSKNILYATDIDKLLERIRDEKDLRIAVIGDGQTGAEIIDVILSQCDEYSSLYWICKGDGPTDQNKSAFLQDFFCDEGIERLFTRMSNNTTHSIKNHGLTSGIDPLLSKQLFEKIYEVTHFSNSSVHLIRNTFISNIVESSNKKIALLDANSHTSVSDLDLVVLATGFNNDRNIFGINLSDYILDQINNSSANRDYYRVMGRKKTCKLFIQGENTNTHGETDGNFIVSPFRNNRIINCLT